MATPQALLARAADESLPLRERLAAVKALIDQRPELGENPEVAQILAEFAALHEDNPLMTFEPHSESQKLFFTARTDIVAAFAGNQFGKSTALIVRALRELLPREVLPPFLRDSKLFDAPTHGWIVCPTNDKIFDPGGLIDVIQRWVPPSELKTGKWDGSWNKERKTLHFRCGSSLGFKTYEQDPSTLGGASLHFVGYDEPPPIRHRNECLVRLVRHGGFEMFAMTPIRTNTGWVRRDIYRQQEAPHITVISGSMHDNPTLDQRKKEMILASFDGDERRAREFGEFMELGGLIYPEFERCVVKAPWSPEFIRGLDVVVGIDPGIRNCGLVWVGFDGELVAHVFDEALLQDKTPAEYAKAIRAKNAYWGLRRVSYVIDPAAKQRAQSNGMTVLSALNQERVYPNLGQNDHELGFGQMRSRMAHRRFLVSPACRGLRDEAMDYAAVEPKEGRDDSHLDPVKGNDHRLDALRYAVLERFWDPVMEAQAPQRQLGWTPGMVPAVEQMTVPQEVGPMGSMS